MKPYGKTFRCSKYHKSTECGICSEQIEKDGKTAIRRKAKDKIIKELEDTTKF